MTLPGNGNDPISWGIKDIFSNFTPYILQAIKENLPKNTPSLMLLRTHFQFTPTVHQRSNLAIPRRNKPDLKIKLKFCVELLKTRQKKYKHGKLEQWNADQSPRNTPFFKFHRQFCSKTPLILTIMENFVHRNSVDISWNVPLIDLFICEHGAA